MTIGSRCSKYMNVRKANIALRIMLTLSSIVTISILVACTPPVNTTSAITTDTTQSPAAADIAFTESPVTIPSLLATRTPAISSTPNDSRASTSTLFATLTSTHAPVTSLTFITEADALVKQSNPDTNYGDAPTLQVDGSSGEMEESFIRFTVSGVSGTVRSARLRVFGTTNGSKNGPALYSTGNSWTETEINWNNRLAPTSIAIDNKGGISRETWVEYDVTPLVTGNGAFSFVLAADSDDGVIFSSGQGSQPPELVVTFSDSVLPTATPTSTLSADSAILVGAGDISSCNNDNDEFTAQLLDTIPGTVFTSGDNAYSSGTLSQFANCYDPTWGRHKTRTRPVPGNHEYQTFDASGYFQYFNNIPPYYAYNLGHWRIYALNSEIDVSADSPQIIWLQDDLAANPSQCVLAYWHKPRWSSGNSHGSNPDLQTLWQILYEAGAELVLNGHEHNYERFAPMNAAGAADPLGLREIVVGTGGRNHYQFGAALPASEVRDSSTYGVLKVTLHATGYDWQFIPIAGSTFTDSGSTDCH